MSKRKNFESIVSSLIIIKDTNKDNEIYNSEYFKPCKSEYIFEHTIYKCQFCLKYYPEECKIITC